MAGTDTTDKPEKMSRYKELTWGDLSIKLAPFLDKGIMSINTEGYFTTGPEDQKTLVINTPWLMVNSDTGPPQNDCFRHHLIKYDLFDILPIACLECYKVVVSPQNLIQMFTLLGIMNDLKYPGKIGMEKRDYSPGLWHAFFYCNGLEHGLKRYYQVFDELQDRSLGDLPIILKRGCTEFEVEMGPSDQWESLISPQQRKQGEPYLDRWIKTTPIGPPHDIAAWLSARLQYQWIEWAAANGDETYLEYTDGVLDQPDAERKVTRWKLPPPPITYHDRGPIKGVYSESKTKEDGHTVSPR